MSLPSTSNATGAHLSITVDELMNLRLVALGKSRPSLIIRNGLVLALHTNEILPRDVVISGRHIAAITPWNHFPTVDHEIEARGKYISPGFIDTHLHIEYTKLVPGELARLSVPKGTTTVLADANCIANVLGEKGMDFMKETRTPLRIFQQVSHKVPGGAPDIELGGVTIPTEVLARRVTQSFAATLGESNPFSLDKASAEKQTAALQAGKRITGHTALLKNEPLWAYAAGGIGDDHNAHQPEDVLERLRLGLMLTVMSGSMNSNIQSVFSDPSLYKTGLNHMSFCADDKFAEDLHGQGHIGYNVRESIRYGVDPVQAYRIATLNAALYYRIDHVVGSVTPAKLADLLILDNLEEARPSTVLINGRTVAENGTALFENTDPVPEFALNTIKVHGTFFDPATYRTYPKKPNATYAYVQAVEMYDGYFKRAFHYKLHTHASEGYLLPEIEHDVLKLVVIDRHHATTHHGTAFVRGFGLKRGAIACTTNCENQNLVVLGTSDEEIAFAAKAVHGLGGGFVAVADGQILGSVELAVAGCMSREPWEDVARKSRELDDIVCRELVKEKREKTMKVPFMILSFVGLVGVPDLGVTELGMVHTGEQKLIDVVLEEEILHVQDERDFVDSSALTKDALEPVPQPLCAVRAQLALPEQTCVREEEEPTQLLLPGGGGLPIIHTSVNTPNTAAGT
ncbi:adenine deaminase [Pleomassaria siparia CBS 279.74]|uniref:adenine deaminase n=1 Tax=Pleomassaria siparia CBS 279.74 TaxID=1314801 RepID=A0A6G1KIE5_9PLEO|nr:adenine deaminase [Pleomassaria siparia CBS 279.74]